MPGRLIQVKVVGEVAGLDRNNFFWLQSKGSDDEELISNINRLLTTGMIIAASNQRDG
jgi:hypothetical protein